MAMMSELSSKKIEKKIENISAALIIRLHQKYDAVIFDIIYRSYTHHVSFPPYFRRLKLLLC